jgi:amino acid adenylation domain-containing protein
VLKAGASFLVLDPAHPARRTADVVERTAPRLLVADRESLVLLASPEAEAAARAERVELEALLRGVAGPVPPAGAGPALAYAAVTSGTTGRPQAVRGAHGPVVQFLRWQRTAFGLSRDDRFALLAGLGHDPLLRDVLAPLSLGATLSIPDEATLRDPDALFDWLDAEAVTVVHATPGLLRLALSAAAASWQKLTALRLVFAGGDELRWSDVRALQAVAPGVRVVNLYGTTETPQGVAFFDTAADPRAIDAEDGPVPIGRGREGVDLLVLDAEDRLAAIGELGEVCVRTPWLTEGYVGDPELTRERFVANPLGASPGDRAYRTGDLGRYRPDGAVALAGRADRQLKQRGYRIDPAEIEAQIAAHPGVRQATVVATGEGDAARLAAFVVPGAPEAPSAGELRAWLLARLPEPFVPADVIAIDRLPLTPNGKVDVARLPVPAAPAEPARVAEAASVQAALPYDDRTFERLAGLWEQHLGTRPTRPEDDFFELGGHSLAAAQLVNAVRRETGTDLSLAEFVSAPSLGAMAHRVAGLPTRFSALVRFREGGDRAPVFLVHPLAGTVVGYRPLVARLSPLRPVYGLQSRALDPEAPVPSTLAELAARHVDDVLRIAGDGPCHLAGHSMGGAIAFEMAVQIAERGGRVGLLALFDTWRPDLERVKPPMPRRVAARLANVGRLHGDERREYVRGWLEGAAQRRGLRLGHTEEALGPMLMRVRRINARAAEAYAPRSYPGLVTLYRAVVRPTDRYDHPDLGWTEYCPGGLEVVRVTGDHESLVAEPHAEGLARLMEERMRD